MFCRNRRSHYIALRFAEFAQQHNCTVGCTEKKKYPQKAFSEALAGSEDFESFVNLYEGQQSGIKTVINTSLTRTIHSLRPQHFLNFFPLPHGQGSFRPTLGIDLVYGIWGPQQDGSLQQPCSSTIGSKLAAFSSIDFAPKSSSTSLPNPPL